jgi:hypothetical protein
VPTDCPVYRQCLSASGGEVLVRWDARRRGTGKRVRRPVSVGFAEYLEANSALTGSPFRWGALAGRLLFLFAAGMTTRGYWGA